jgi:hypothetical protein
MTENSFCCRGLDDCCWQEIIADGIWDFTLKDVEVHIKSILKHIKKYLYNQNKYDKRFYKFENEDGCIIYIYLRDILEVDYVIWFANEDR